MGSDTVVVTGFGPFAGHAVNASWEAVKLLPSLNTEGELDVKLVTVQIPVSYNFVEEKIPALWRKYHPLLVVHVGVSSAASAITLELGAYKSGYSQPDVEGQAPCNGRCRHGCEEKIEPIFDVRRVSNEINGADHGILTCVSSNAGRYLCEFIYYTSLSIDNSRAMFIHVPELNKPYSAKQLATGIKKILSVLVREVRNQKCQIVNNSVE